MSVDFYSSFLDEQLTDDFLLYMGQGPILTLRVSQGVRCRLYTTKIRWSHAVVENDVIEKLEKLQKGAPITVGMMKYFLNQGSQFYDLLACDMETLVHKYNMGDLCRGQSLDSKFCRRLREWVSIGGFKLFVQAVRDMSMIYITRLNRLIDGIEVCFDLSTPPKDFDGRCKRILTQYFDCFSNLQMCVILTHLLTISLLTGKARTQKLKFCPHLMAKKKGNPRSGTFMKYIKAVLDKLSAVSEGKQFSMYNHEYHKKRARRQAEEIYTIRELVKIAINEAGWDPHDTRITRYLSVKKLKNIATIWLQLRYPHVYEKTMHRNWKANYDVCFFTPQKVDIRHYMDPADRLRANPSDSVMNYNPALDEQWKARKKRRIEVGAYENLLSVPHKQPVVPVEESIDSEEAAIIFGY